MPFSFADLVERVSPAVVTITSRPSPPRATTRQRAPTSPAPFRDLFNQFEQGGRRASSRTRGSAPAPASSSTSRANRHQQPCHRQLQEDHRHPAGQAQLHRQADRDRSGDRHRRAQDQADKPLPTVEFGNDRDVRVGDWVVAVGNPFGLSNSVTAGIVSSLGRDIGAAANYNDFIQIDAPINQGNSGGPTFDLRGQVVGMNSMIYSPSAAASASASPFRPAPSMTWWRAARAWPCLARLSWRGNPERTPDIANSLGLKEPRAPSSPGSCRRSGRQGGLQQGDIVTAINGKAVEDNRDLTRKVASSPPAPAPTFTVNRQGKRKQHQGPDRRPSRRKLASATPATPSAMPADRPAPWDWASRPLTPEARKTFSLADNAPASSSPRSIPTATPPTRVFSPAMWC